MTIADRFARLSTGSRLLLLLSFALLPIGILAVIASLQSTRSADIERRAMLRVSATESARRLGSELALDMTTLRSAANLLERGADEATVCARTASVLATSFGERDRFALVTRGGRLVCGSPDIAAAASPRATAPITAQVSTTGVDLQTVSDTRAFIGVTRYPREQLARLLRPQSLSLPSNISLAGEGGMLTIDSGFERSRLERSESVTITVPGMPLSLLFEVRSVPFTTSQLLTMVLPLLMWLAALVVAWIVIQRFILEPLGVLRANIADYRPGEIMRPLRRMTIPAREIDDLGETFRAISQTVAAHESELALGLSRQTKLTREVHHRVKNNLQVVSSLINLHARAARNPEAIAAYASIGRRVDALAVVHRNHFAELEENRGVNLRSLIGELTSNLRATAPAESARLAILMDVPSLYVGQDTAIPLAFLLTELIELAMGTDPAAAVRVHVVPEAEPGRALLSIGSDALRDGDGLRRLMDERYGRVLEGLSRQLRSKLERDFDRGVFSLSFPIIPEGSEEREKN
jgi:two-component system, sensor histidine kinase PdtaS